MLCFLKRTFVIKGFLHTIGLVHGFFIIRVMCSQLHALKVLNQMGTLWWGKKIEGVLQLQNHTHRMFKYNWKQKNDA